MTTVTTFRPVRNKENLQSIKEQIMECTNMLGLRVPEHEITNQMQKTITMSPWPHAVPLQEINQTQRNVMEKRDFMNGDMVQMEGTSNLPIQIAQSNDTMEDWPHNNYDSLFLSLASQTTALDGHLAKKLQRSCTNDDCALKRVSSISTCSQISTNRPVKKSVLTRTVRVNQKICKKGVLSQRRSNKKLSMSALNPGVRYMRPPSAESGCCFRILYDGQNRQKKRGKSLKEKTPRLSTVETSDSDEKEKGQSKPSSKTYSRNQFNDENSDEDKTKSSKRKKQSTEAENEDEFNNNECSEDSEDSDEEKAVGGSKIFFQFNNNSIPNGTSFVSLAREMLKKNSQPTCSHQKPSKPYLDTFTYSRETEFNRTMGSTSNEDLDDENQSSIYDDYRNFEKSRSRGKENDKVSKMSKISRSSLNTLQTYSSKKPNNSDKIHLYSVQGSSIVTGNKKSRMYVKSNLPMKRMFQPINVVNYLMERYSDRLPKLSENGLGYDQTVKNVVKILHDSWLEQTHCDVTIATEYGGIMAHQAVLSSFSKSLAHQFKANRPTCDPNDTSQDSLQHIAVIDMSKFSRDIIADTLHFLYTTDIKLDANNVTNFIKVAKRLEVPVLLQMCEEYLVTASNLDNIMQHYLIANTCDMTEINEEMQRRIAKSFDIIWSKKHVVKLSRSLLLGLLTHKDLNITEENKLKVIAKWIDYNRSKRLKDIPELMKHVNFENFDLDSLMTQVQSLDWMFTDQAMRTKLLDAYKYHLQVSNNVNANHDSNDYSNHNIGVNGQQSKQALSSSQEHQPIIQSAPSSPVSGFHRTQTPCLMKTQTPLPCLGPQMKISVSPVITLQRGCTTPAPRVMTPIHLNEIKPLSFASPQLKHLQGLSPSSGQKVIEVVQNVRNLINDELEVCQKSSSSMGLPALCHDQSPTQPQLQQPQQHQSQQCQQPQQIQQSQPQQYLQEQQPQTPLQMSPPRYCQQHQQTQATDLFVRGQQQQEAITRRVESKCFQTDYQPQQVRATTNRHRFANVGTCMTPNISQNANEMDSGTRLGQKQNMFRYNQQDAASTASSSEAKNWSSNKSQGVVSVFQPFFKSTPFKQYQLTNTSSTVRFVEL